jgi:F-type H+-transporting ATPase subunit beta
MSYYVYENWTQKRTRIHRSDCSYCNEGRGTHGGNATRNGRWHGPIPARDAAVALAESLKRHDTKICAHCSA